MNVSFAPFEPDKATYNAGASAAVTNVMPVADGWGPMPSFTPYADALPLPPRGSITARTAAGIQISIVSTAAKLYKVENDGSLTDISTGTYSVPDGDEWSFALFGDRIIATNLTDGPKYFDIGSSTKFVTLPGSPPKARFVKVIGDFVALYQLAVDKSAIHWSGINNSEQWVPGEELCDINSFPDGEELMAVAVHGSGATLVFRKGFRTMTFEPSSGYIFIFSPYVEGMGCSAPRSLVEIGGGEFVYYSETGFYRGPSQTPIGAERVDRWFKAVCAQDARGKLKGVQDPFRKAVLYRYEDAGGNGLILGYSWQLDRWFQSQTNISGLGIYSTSAIGLDDLDDLYGNLDAIPISLDSESFAGGMPSLAGFDESYRLGFFDGLPQQAAIYTNAIEFTPGARSYVDPIRVYTDAQVFTVQVGESEAHGDSPVWGGELLPSSRSRLCYARSDARLHSFCVNLPEASSWSVITGLDAPASRSSDL